MLVEVPAGKHTLVVRYSDPYFFTGAALSGVVVIALAAVAYRLRKRPGG